MLAVAQSEREVSLPQLPLEQDLFGRVLLDYSQGRASEYFLRRDDNLVERDSISRYFRSWEKLPVHQRCLLNHACGRVLDIGAGAGQHTLALQERGTDVLAIDVSPLAVDVCRTRGVKQALLMDARDLQLAPESFDTVLLLGNNLGIAGTPDGLRHLLLQLHAIVRPGGQILADITDFTATHDPSHLRYQRWNVSHGRYPGSIGLRIEYDGKCGPHFNWLLTKLPELKRTLGDTGWRMARCVQVTGEATYAIGVERV